MPLRLKPYKKVLGIGKLQYTDFIRGWAEGLEKLLEQLQRQKVKGNPDKVTINPNWEIFRRRSAIPLIDEPERLTSNQIRVAEYPDTLHYFEPSRAMDAKVMSSTCDVLPFPVIARERGFYAL